MNKIFLQSPRVILTEITPSDAPLLLELDSDPDVMKHLTDGKPSSPEEVESAMKRILEVIHRHQYKFGFWLAFTKDTNEFMGWFLFRPDKATPDDVKSVELGYRLKKQFWAQGFATEVAALIINHGFKNLDIESVFAITMKANLASQRVMQKVGLKYFSDYTEDLFPGDDKSAVRYVLRREDWEKSQGSSRH